MLDMICNCDKKKVLIEGKTQVGWNCWAGDVRKASTRRLPPASPWRR